MSILFFKILYPEASIIGFEPDETTFQKLQENIKLNKLQNVQVHRKVLSDIEGLVDFFYYPDHSGSLSMSIIRERTEKKCKKVDSVLLSKYINETVDFLKLDTEGAETAIIQELHSQDKLQFIKTMAVEYHHHFEHYHFTEQNDGLSQILRILEKNNFGYQIKAESQMPTRKGIFQPIHIYAYQKC
jgi:FkbM family methyltransferase